MTWAGLKPRAGIELPPAVSLCREAGHGHIQVAGPGEGVGECYAAFLAVIAADGGFVARGDPRRSGAILLAVIERVLEIADPLQGEIEGEVETLGEGLGVVLQTWRIEAGKTWGNRHVLIFRRSRVQPRHLVQRGTRVCRGRKGLLCIVGARFKSQNRQRQKNECCKEAKTGESLRMPWCPTERPLEHFCNPFPLSSL